MFFWKPKSTGEQGEKLASRFLRKKGWRIVKRNLRVDKDEIDILAVSPKGETLALVEVRATENPSKDPRVTVGHEKRRCMRRAAAKLRAVATFHGCNVRIDLITVNLGCSPPRIAYYESTIPFSLQK
ncbi:MAG: YraN family protein [Planctomycetes bacterium]|nr:YraN family protein [Planctomycetota bacterium]